MSPEDREPFPAIVRTYGVELVSEKLRPLAAAVPETYRLFREDIEAFLRLMEASE